MLPDYYDILNLPANAPQGSIARAAQARGREISADGALSESEKNAASVLVREAHRTLDDPARRAQYDIDFKLALEESERPKPVVKKKEEFSYLRIGLAMAILVAIVYFSITGYQSRQERLANDLANCPHAPICSVGQRRMSRVRTRAGAARA